MNRLLAHLGATLDERISNLLSLVHHPDPVMADLALLARDGHATDRQRAIARSAQREVLRLRKCLKAAAPPAPPSPNPKGLPE